MGGGGETEEQVGHHYHSPSQRYAADLLVTGENGQTFSGTNYMKNEAFHAFGLPVHSPCEGTVITVVNGEQDNLPRFTNPYNAFGNYVVIRTSEGAYIVLAHFKKDSLVVKEGDTVNPGDLLGLCGNSGNSTEPHLHIHAQDGPDLNYSAGVRIVLENVRVNGEDKEIHHPKRGDYLGNPGKIRLPARVVALKMKIVDHHL